MKKIHRSQLAWAAFALALAAGSLAAQDGDASARKPMLLAEALKARDEGNLEVAKEKFEAILAIDPKDMGANEGLTSVNAALAEASSSKQSADAASAVKAAAPSDAAPASPVAAPAAPSALDEVASAHQNRFDEVSRAIAVAKAKADAGDLKRAQEILDGANGAIAAIPTAAAQKLRDAISLAKQDLAVRRDAGSASVAQEEVKRLAKDNSAALSSQGDAIDAAEKLLRKGTAEYVDKAISDLDAADRALGAETLSNKDLKERIKSTKASALARRALLAIDARDMTRAAALVADYAKLKGEQDPAVLRLQKELAAKRNEPTYRNIDELSPGVSGKDDKVNELLVRGRARYLYGDYQGALDAYREVLQYQPNNSESKAYQIRIRQMLSDNSGQWNRGVTKGKLMELLDETWKLPEVFNRENTKSDLGNGNDPVTEKMKTIRLPEGFIARDEPLDRALTKLSGLSQTYDKDQKGVNIVPVTDGGESPTVNLQLRDVTVFQALDYLCKRVGYSFSVSPSGIVEVRKDAGDSLLDTQFFELTQAAVVKMTGQGLNTTAPGGAASNPFGGAGGAAGPSDGNPQEMAIKSFLIRSGVPFEPPATLSFDGTRLIVTGSPKNLDRVKNIIRRYSDIKQVHIEAKFIEVEQKALNELGVNWSLTPTVENNGGVTAGTNLRSIQRVFAQNNTAPKNLTINSQVTTDQGVGADPRYTTTSNLQTFANVAPVFPGGMNLGQIANNYAGTVNILSRETLALTIRAIEESAGSDLMSSPSLTVLDGKTAVIKVAQLLRYPQAYGDIQSNVGQGGGGAGGVLGVAQTSVAITAGTPQDFTVQEVGVTLEVTPTVAADDSIALNLKPKVTEFEGFVEYGGTSVALTGGVTVTVPSGFFQPIFSTREVTTDVTVFDGATVVIGGLTREEVKTIDDKVPVLGSIPLIGAAFRSSGKSVAKRSLMVFVTANLVSPGGATLRSSHPGMRAGATFSNPTIISPGGAVYREPIEAASPTEPAPIATEPAK
jgi:general secretion pathway protein D